jgi:hypothetical protein
MRLCEAQAVQPGLDGLLQVAVQVGAVRFFLRGGGDGDEAAQQGLEAPLIEECLRAPDGSFPRGHEASFDESQLGPGGSPQAAAPKGA